MDQVKADAVDEFQTYQPYFNELEVQYGDRFEDFHKQATLLFSSVDFSQVQIDSLIPMTLHGEDVPDEEETNLRGTKATALVVNGTNGQGEEEADEHLTQPTQLTEPVQTTEPIDIV